MIPVLLLLSLAPATCSRDEHRCQAERYLALAEESQQAGDHATRVQRLYLAHREFLYLFDATGEAASLCRAGRVLNDARALKPTPQHLVAHFKSAVQETKRRKHKAGITCGTRSKSAAAHAVLKAEDAAPAPGMLPVEREGGSTIIASAEPVPSRESPVQLAAVGQDDPPPADPSPTSPAMDKGVHVAKSVPPEPAASSGAQGDRAEGPEPGPPTSPTPPRSPTSRRARLGGGVALVLAGAGFAGGMVGALLRRAELTQTFRELEANAEGRPATEAELLRAGQLNHDYGVLTFVAATTGVAMVVSLVAGGVLLRKKSRSVLALPWSGSRAAGLTLRGQF